MSTPIARWSGVDRHRRQRRPMTPPCRRTTGNAQRLHVASAGRRPLHLVAQLAEAAHFARRHLPAAHALVESDVLRLLEGGPRLVEEAEEEIMLGARRVGLHAVEHFLV